MTGASGLLGANLCLAAADRGWTVTAVSGRTPFRADGVASEQVDLRDGDAVRRLVERARPDAVIHCAAMTDVDACETDPDAAFAVNADAAGVLAQAAAEGGARMVHVSTDAVFDGVHGGYREADPTAPVNVYGESKLAGEHTVLAASPDHVVARTTLFGWNAQAKHSLAEWALARLEAGDRVPGFTDAVFAPLEASTLSGFLLDLAGLDRSHDGADAVGDGATSDGGNTDAVRQTPSVLHLGSADAVSKYDFARTVADVWGHDPGRVDPTVMADVGFRAPRPARTALDPSRAAAVLGHPMPTVADGLRRMRALAETGWRDRLGATVR